MNSLTTLGVDKPTEREIEALWAAATTPDLGAAGALINLTESSIANVLLGLRRKLGVKTNLQAYAKLVGGVRLITTVEVRLELLDARE